MKNFKFLFFLIVFASIAVLVSQFRASKPNKIMQDPGWHEQLVAMKNPIDGISYYGLRNSWQKQDALYKKGTDVLSYITEMGPKDVAGRVRALLIDAKDSSHIFAGGISGGLWVSNNGGQSWKAINEHNVSMAITCITQNPFNANEIYYGTGEGTGNSADLSGAGIFKSIDGGLTFNQLASTASNTAFSTIWDVEFSKTDSSTLYVGVANGGLYRSINNGSTFKVVYPSSKAIHEIVTYQDSSIWFGLEAYGLISATEDTSMKFTRFSGVLPTTGIGRISMSYCKTYPKVAYCQMVNTGGTALVGIYKTSNHGQSWKKMTSPTITGTYSWAWYCFNTAVSPKDTNIVLSISVKGLGSIDGGVTWKEIKASHADYQSSAFYPSGKSLLIGNDGGVYRYNANTLFTNNVSLNNDLNITQFYTGNIHPFSSESFIGGTQDNGTHAYDGFNFSKALGGDGSYCAFSSEAPFYVYASYQNGALRRLDSDFGNETIITPPGTNTYWFINPIEVNPLDGNQIYVLSKTKILASSNSGNSWRDLTLPLNKIVLSMGMSYEKDPTVYFGGGGNTLYRSKKANSMVQKEVDLTNTAPALAKGSVINCIKVSLNDPNTVYISMSDINTKPRVWKLKRAESDTPTWINISGNLPVSLPVNCVEVNSSDSNVILAGTDFGLYTTANGGVTWSKETAVPNVPIHKIVSHPKNGVIYIFTHGRGVFKSQFKNYSPSTGILVANFNAPKIQFNNPIESHLNLSIGDNKALMNANVYIYSTKGELVYGNTVGAHSSLDISRLSTGVYILNIQIGKDLFSKRILKL